MSTSTRDDPRALGIAQRLRFLARDSAIYGGAAALNKATALITFPILARHFSVEEYGVLDFMLVLSAVLTILFVFGQDTAVARYFYEHEDADSRQKIISQSLALQVGALVALIPVGMLVVVPLVSGFLTVPDAPTVLRIVLFQVPFLLLINFSQNILKWTFRRGRFLIVSMGSTSLSVAALVVVILFFDADIVEVMLVYLATQAIFGLTGLWFVRGWLRIPSNWDFARPLLRFAIPYGIVCTLGAASPVIQRTVVASFLGADALGVFAAGAKVALLIALPVRAFQIAWGPFSLAIFKEADAAETYNWVLKGLALAVCTAVMLLGVVAEPVIRVLASDRYAAGAAIVFPLALGLGVEATGWITSLGISLSKRSYLNLYSYVVFTLVSVGSMLALVGPLGAQGVAWGAMLGYLCKTVAESWLAQRAYPLGWDYSGVVVLVSATLVLGAIAQVVATRYGYQVGAVLSGLNALLVLTIGWRHVFGAGDRRRILTAIAR